MSMCHVYILLISKHVSGIIITIFPVIHIGCCPHVCQRLLVYLWTTYQKLPISVWCMFPVLLLSVLVCYFIKLFYRLVFIIWHVYSKCELSYLLFYCHARQDLFTCWNFKCQLSEFIYNGVLVRVVTITTVSPPPQSRTQTSNLVSVCVDRGSGVVMRLNCIPPRSHRTSYTI